MTGSKKGWKIPEKRPHGSKHHNSKYFDLKNDPDILRWFNNVSEGSVITAEVYLRRLGGFCIVFNKTPQSLLKMEEKEIYNILLDFVGMERKKNRSPGYIHTVVKAVKSWLLHNDIKIDKKIKIAHLQSTPSLVDERIPTKDELRDILLNAHIRERVSVALMAFSGIRPQVLGNHDGTDGLRMRDFPEIEIRNGKIEFKNIPTIVIVRPELSKTKRQYMTFLGEEGCEYLKAYLQDRVNKGETLVSSSDIIKPFREQKQFTRTIKVGENIRCAIRAAGYKWRPYVLRAYFDTQLLMAESQGQVTHSYRQFWMGHFGDMDARYTTNKNKLPENLIEDMRKAYRQAQPSFQTRLPAGPSSEEIKAMFANMGLTVAGYSEDELKDIDIKEMPLEEVAELMKKKLTPTALPVQNGNRQKVVSVDEAETLISQGWSYISTLPNQRIVVKAPCSAEQPTT